MYEPNVVWSHHEVDVFGVNPSRPEIAAKPVAFKSNFVTAVAISTAVDSVVRITVEGPRLSAATIVSLLSTTLIALFVLCVWCVLRVLRVLPLMSGH
jgi:hypothetical protein